MFTSEKVSFGSLSVLDNTIPFIDYSLGSSRDLCVFSTITVYDS